MTAVINSLSFWNAGPDSDIDLLVVTEPGYLPTVRDHINLFLTSRNRRNTRPPKRGKVAVDILITTERLNIHDLRLRGQDIYFDFWAAHIAPLLNSYQTYERFISENRWIAQCFPNFTPHLEHIMNVDPGRLKVQERYESFYRSQAGSSIQRLLARYHMHRMHRYEARVRDSGTVVVSPELMRFNIPDRRHEYQQRFEERWHAVTGSPWS